MSDALTIFDRLRDEYVRYYETPFSVRDDAVMRERHALLLEDGVIAREPWIEPIAPYKNVDHDIAESCRVAGAHPDLAAFAPLGLIDPRFSLRTHQEAAYARRAPTSSMLWSQRERGRARPRPSYCRFYRACCKSQPAGCRTARKPRRSGGQEMRFVAQRKGESGRDAAVRALILYPMNALVEDQLQRLRKALDSDAVRTWLDTNRGGHRFFFGRYTGKTPVSGPQSRSRRKDPGPSACRSWTNWQAG